jgi:peptide/nickel transport system ATP-binding protein
VMRHGLLLEEAPTQALFRQPLHAYTRSLLGAVPTMRTDLRKPLAVLSGQAEGQIGLADPVPLRELAPGHWARVEK